jgi:Bacterial pre-peptidase C-terminal domain
MNPTLPKEKAMLRKGQIVIALVIGLVAIVALGCNGSQIATEDVDENVIVHPGKEDNFFSNVAQEYNAEATVQVQLDASYAQKSAAEQMARARKIMEGKTKQIGWFLHVYLIDKSSSDDAGDYGGLRAMVLDGSYDSDALKQDQDDPTKFTFSFAVQVGGTNKLLSKVRKDNNLAADVDTFGLKMAKLTNSRLINFSHSGYGAGDWSPEKCNCDVETLQVKLTAIEASKDAYLDYGNMLDDDVMDVSVHFGWDYHARYDITHSRNLYNWLVNSMGFTSPVSSYQEYNRLSGPLTKQITVNGQSVTAKVTIFRPDPCEAWDEDGRYGAWAKAVKADKNNKKRSCPDHAWADPKANANSTTSTGAGNLMKDLKASMRTRDAIIFSGHSGYTYAYALASWYKTSAGDLDPPEIKTMSLPKDKSQLFVLSGCDTYHAAQAFKDNPNKLGLINADVVTTTSFSNAADLGDTKDMIQALTGDGNGKLTATSYGKVMKDLNPRSYDSGWGHYTMYGVHGIDDNPLRNPLGDPTKTCTSCNSDSDCGADGNVCVRLNQNEKVCATECLHDDGCSADQVCRRFGSSSTGYLKGMACVPKSLACSVTPPPPPVGNNFSGSGDLARGETKFFSVAVGTDAKNIKVTITGTNDADLYTQFDQAPTKSDYSCRPYKAGSKETCSYTSAKGTTLEIMVRGYSSKSSHFELKVSWD